jgi:hypothetical protein
LLVVLLLLVLLLLLLEGACVVTPLLTNRAGIGRTRKSKTKWGSDIFWSRWGFNFYFIFSFSRVKTQEEPWRFLKLPESSKKERKQKKLLLHARVPRWSITP